MSNNKRGGRGVPPLPVLLAFAFLACGIVLVSASRCNSKQHQQQQQQQQHSALSLLVSWLTPAVSQAAHRWDRLVVNSTVDA